MTTQPISQNTLPPLPNATLEAVRAAIVAFAPLRLPELDREKDEALAQALAHNSLGPVRLFLERWRTIAAIGRDPALASRFRSAEYVFRSSQDAAERRKAALEIAMMLQAAKAEVDRG